MTLLEKQSRRALTSPPPLVNGPCRHHTKVLPIQNSTASTLSAHLHICSYMSGLSQTAGILACMVCMWCIALCRLPLDRNALQVALPASRRRAPAHDKKHSSLRSQNKTKWGQRQQPPTQRTLPSYSFFCLSVCHALQPKNKKEGSFPSRLPSSSTGTERVENEWLWRSEGERAATSSSRSPALTHFALPLSKAWTLAYSDLVV